jgi:hypothetical protein
MIRTDADVLPTPRSLAMPFAAYDGAGSARRSMHSHHVRCSEFSMTMNAGTARGAARIDRSLQGCGAGEFDVPERSVVAVSTLPYSIGKPHEARNVRS